MKAGLRHEYQAGRLVRCHAQRPPHVAALLGQAFDALLQPDKFRDYGPNGLQVEGDRDVQLLVSGVTASRALIEAAIDAQADAIVVHHGLFWRGQDGRVTGWMRERLRLLLAHGIHLFCYGTIAGGFLSNKWLGQPDPPQPYANRSLVKYRLMVEEFGGWDRFQELLRQLTHLAARVEGFLELSRRSGHVRLENGANRSVLAELEVVDGDLDGRRLRLVRLPLVERHRVRAVGVGLDRLLEQRRLRHPLRLMPARPM